ncbi:transmembrane protein, putative (macronuclear) [Tetrahymena thermophila SB210]|uniref:Transmembrane protein, putative n=1 Tax=Tetrahymena thermophila (strain SB210) TaxID=312017 RepID=Q22V54_TETTS|nr:transmembrane protein, putative [Tetrahymena thermophila SB210]EAR89094.1 transmembrane protein, putative [Tetrahymena thermophila SB210]|eukprot:XP_001009339.1 transmembrane protein, putative [Tetrahymena thermophila SB210]
MMKIIFFISSLIIKGLCFSLLELGVPIESIIHSQHRESFLVNDVGKLNNLIIQLNLRYGKVQFGVDLYNKTKNYMNSTVESYRWHSNVFSEVEEGYDIKENQINIDIKDVLQVSMSNKLVNKLKRFEIKQKFIVTIEAHQSAKYKLVAVSDRVYLKANSTMRFLLPTQNSTMSFIIEAGDFFLLNTYLNTGQANLKINKLNEELAIADSSSALSHQQIPIQQIIQDSESMLEQVLIDRESFQIGYKKKGIMQYVITFESKEQKPINVFINWSSSFGTVITQKYDTFYGKLFNSIIGNGSKGKQMVKILIMGCLVLSLLLYSIIFVFRNMNSRKYEMIKQYWEEDEENILK